MKLAGSILLIFFSVILFLLIIRHRKNTIEMLIKSIYKKNETDFYRVYDSLVTKLLIDKYQLSLLELNLNFLMENNEKIDEIYRRLMSDKKKKRSKLQVLIMLYNYYLLQEDQVCAKEILTALAKYKNNQIERQQVMYEIIFENSVKYLQELEAQTEKVDSNLLNYFLLYKMYESKKDEIKAKAYLKKYHSCLLHTK